MQKVVILLSTYNGERYLQEQIDSLLNQSFPSIEIYVRDDGSTDSTLSILEDYKNQGKLAYYSGKNLGPAYSFIDLIKNAPEADFYALCDQDDVWEPEKIEHCIKAAPSVNKPILIYHGMNVVDQSLNTIGHYFRRDIYSKSLINSCLYGDEIAGCTMVFNKLLLNAINSFYPPFLTMHDGWIHRVCLAINGEIVPVNEELIKYRQHSHNTVGIKGHTILDKINNARNSDHKFSTLAKQMIAGYKERMTKDTLDFLLLYSEYQKSSNMRKLIQYSNDSEATKSEKLQFFIKAKLRVL